MLLKKTVETVSSSLKPFQSEKVPKCLFDQNHPEINEIWNSPEPVDLEIGCGVGYHPIKYIQDHPERRLIAIEKTREKFDKFKRRVLNHGEPRGLYPVHGNAISIVTHWIPEQRLDKVFILYPNPEPKKKHLNQRWYAMPFTGELIRKIKRGGRIILATNIEEYAHESWEWFQKEWKLKGILKESFLLGELMGKDPRSHFEKKYLQSGQRCWNLEFEKI